MRFITCRLPDGVEDPAILSEDGRQVWPLSWLGLSYETLSEAIPFLTPQVRYGLSLAIAGIPALPVEAVTLESPIPAPAQDVICLGINYFDHAKESERVTGKGAKAPDTFPIYFSKRVHEAVAPGGEILRRCLCHQTRGCHLLFQARDPRRAGRRPHRGPHRSGEKAGL